MEEDGQVEEADGGAGEEVQAMKGGAELRGDGGRKEGGTAKGAVVDCAVAGRARSGGRAWEERRTSALEGRTGGGGGEERTGGQE